MTVLENLMLIPENQIGEKIWNTWFRPRVLKQQENRIKDRVLEVLEFVELIDHKDEYAGSLSGGQKKAPPLRGALKIGALSQASLLRRHYRPVL